MSMPNEPRPRRTRLALVLAVVVALTVLAACSSSSKSGSSSSSGSPVITMQNTAFNVAGPVKAGATVDIKNNDPFTHTVTSDDGTSFNVSVDGGKTATITAPSKPGTYKFHCNIHSNMHATLIVQ
jgi:plastocyanin